MNLQDAMYNWLSIKVVADKRPDDQAAQDTRTFFEEILTEDHHISLLEVKSNHDYYIVHYHKDELKEIKKFPIELIDALLTSIQSEPKYNE
ncbi:hypothetical protein ABFG93_03020 [Pseudalkalibacillus hwajinpoensis]|uniref:hypothetical protein n=1 Tax=Guptibacillus hwajinpoensis TaxID=208199 RepID=UPI00325BB147